MTRVGALVSAVAFIAFAAPAAAAPADLESLFRPLQFSKSQLSPSGRSLAAVVASNDTRNVAVLDLAAGSAVALTNYTRPFEVIDVRWQNDHRIAYAWAQRSPDAAELRILSSVESDGKNSRQLGPGWIPSYRDFDLLGAVLSFQRSDPTALVIPLISKSGYVDATEAFPVSGRMVKLASAPARNCRYTMDNAGVVRACLSLEEDQSRQLLYRDAQGAQWRTLRHFAAGQGALRPVGFAPDNKTLYVISNVDRDTAALFDFNPVENKLGGLLFAAPGVDVNSGIYAADGHTLIGVTYVDGYRRAHFLDEGMQSVQQSVEAGFPDAQVSIVNWSQDEQRALVLVSGPREPGKYFLLDRQSGKLTFLVDCAPWIDRAALAATRPVTFKSRDGLTIHGYLTLPPARKAENLPLILRSRDWPLGGQVVAGWDPAAQWFASLGYAVLDVNYRGSSGYGREFEQRGKHEIGRKIQDDLADAVSGLLAQGLIARQRTCVLGETFGGYGALMAAAESPELYRCAIAIGGITDLSSMLQKEIRTSNIYRDRSRDEIAYWTSELRVGTPDSLLDGHSPIDWVGKMAVPVFLAHGYEDIIVPYGDSVKYKEALERAHKPVRFFSSKEEGHGFVLKETLVALYSEIAKFLEQYDPAT